MIEVACAVIRAENRVLIAQRGPGRDEGLWEFPGGKKKPGETILQAAERELKEELGLGVTAIQELTSYCPEHIANGQLKLVFIECVCNDIEPSLKEHISVALVELEELEKYTFIPGDENFVRWYIKQY